LDANSDDSLQLAFLDVVFVLKETQIMRFVFKIKQKFLAEFFFFIWKLQDNRLLLLWNHIGKVIAKEDLSLLNILVYNRDKNVEILIWFHFCQKWIYPKRKGAHCTYRVLTRHFEFAFLYILKLFKLFKFFGDDFWILCFWRIFCVEILLAN